MSHNASTSEDMIFDILLFTKQSFVREISAAGVRPLSHLASAYLPGIPPKRPGTAGKNLQTGDPMNTRKYLTLPLVLAILTLVGCGGKTGRRNNITATSTFAVKMTTSQAPSGDLTVAAVISAGAAGETISTTQFTVEKELANGQRLAVPFVNETQAHTVRILGVNLADAVRIRIQVEAFSNLGNRDTHEVTLEGTGVQTEFVPHPTNPSLLQFRIRRQDQAVNPVLLLNAMTLDSPGLPVKTLFTEQTFAVGWQTHPSTIDPTVERTVMVSVKNEDNSSSATLMLNTALGLNPQVFVFLQ